VRTGLRAVEKDEEDARDAFKDQLAKRRGFGTTTVCIQRHNDVPASPIYKASRAGLEFSSDDSEARTTDPVCVRLPVAPSAMMPRMARPVMTGPRTTGRLPRDSR
jgi:hypothetical protein